MPRYRFHIYNDEETLDETGRDFPDFAAARIDAIYSARDLMCAEIRSKGEINLSHWIELENDAGEIDVINFSDAVTIRQ